MPKGLPFDNKIIITKKGVVLTEKEKTGIGCKIVNIVRKLLLILFCMVILGSAILFANSSSTNKSVFGYRYYTVLTASMSPKLEAGDLIFVKVVTASEIKVGDIITFNPSNSSDVYLTHRVIEKLENYNETGVTCFKTKGDANEDPDEILIDEARVIGKETFCIRKLGYIIRFVQLRWYYVIIIIILFIIMLKLMDMYIELKDSGEDGKEEVQDNIKERETQDNTKDREAQDNTKDREAQDNTKEREAQNNTKEKENMEEKGLRMEEKYEESKDDKIEQEE